MVSKSVIKKLKYKIHVLNFQWKERNIVIPSETRHFSKPLLYTRDYFYEQKFDLVKKERKSWTKEKDL